MPIAAHLNCTNNRKLKNCHTNYAINYCDSYKYKVIRIIYKFFNHRHFCDLSWRGYLSWPVAMVSQSLRDPLAGSPCTPPPTSTITAACISERTLRRRLRDPGTCFPVLVIFNALTYIKIP
jgi:hypothetical protein